jgi:nitrogen regulatory protein PII
MPPVAAKLVTIITDFATRDTVERELATIGIRAFSVFQVRGHGRHGVIRGGILQSENVQFNVVTDAAHATKLLEWAERELVPNFPGIAWVSDVSVVSGSRPKPKRG